MKCSCWVMRKAGSDLKLSWAQDKESPAVGALPRRGAPNPQSDHTDPGNVADSSHVQLQGIRTWLLAEEILESYRCGPNSYM